MKCECYSGWDVPGNIACSLPNCPGEPDCFDRGYCNITYSNPRCTDCDPGWMGVDCNTKCVHGTDTPKNSGDCKCDSGWTGKSCDSECSGHGDIDVKTKKCVCDYKKGYKGELCEIPGCPGLFNKDCSDRGIYSAMWDQY